MRFWATLTFALVAPLALGSCLWGPGKFNSTLELRKDGTFTLDYKGEILMQLPEENEPGAGKPWSDDMATCSEEGETFLKTDFQLEADSSGPANALPPNDDDKVDAYAVRPCTKEELAGMRADYEKRQAERIAVKRQESEQMAKLFGLPGSDDASNRAFAEKLKRYAGWRSVDYKGKGVFDVDYRIEGRTDQDFAFPLMPDSDLMIPFVTIRRRADGTALVTAPAFTGGTGPFGARAKTMGLPNNKGEGPRSRAEGRFTIVTDGEILTNNSEDGPLPHAAGRQVHWDVGPVSSKVPEMLVRF